MRTQNLIANSSSPYSFNGMEKDTEVKGANNSYTTFFRQNDPRLGRWLSIDPKVTAFDSPYMSMGNNPILANDQLGDKIKFNKGENVSGKEFRQTKRMVKQEMKNNSESFNSIYKAMDDDKKQTITYNINNVDQAKTGDFGGSTIRKDENNIEVNLNMIGGTAASFLEKVSLTAHESIHAFRIFMGMTEEVPEEPAAYSMKKYHLIESKQYVSELVRIRQKEEAIGVHGENIIMSELKRSGNEKFKAIDLDLTYSSMPVIKKSTAFVNLKEVETMMIGFEIHTIESTLINEEYYNNTLNISNEIQRTDIKSTNYLEFVKKKFKR